MILQTELKIIHKYKIVFSRSNLALGNLNHIIKKILKMFLFVLEPRQYFLLYFLHIHVFTKCFVFAIMVQRNTSQNILENYVGVLRALIKCLIKYLTS